VALNAVRSLLLFVALIVANGCGDLSTSDEPSVASEPRKVTVERVVDGDTIEVRPAIDGIEDVRLIGIDTPEKFGTDGPQPLAEAATDFTEYTLGDSKSDVELRFDVEKTDQYGRLLAYVYTTDGAMLNKELVLGGHAQAANFPPNTRHRDEFEDAQEEARDRGLGIWNLPGDRSCELADRGNGIGGGC